MSTRILLWLVLLGLCGTGFDASRDRRIYKQLDTFKDYVTDEIGYLKEDITTLFDSLKNITTSDNSLSIEHIAEQLDEKYGRLIHAFEAEKILDRKSNEQITSNQESIADLYQLIADNKNELSALKKDTLDVKAEQILDKKTNEQLYQLIADNKNEISEELSVLKKETLDMRAEQTLNKKLNDQTTTNKESIADIFLLIASHKKELSVLKHQTLEENAEDKLDQELNEQLTAKTETTTKQSDFIDYCKQDSGVQYIYVNAVSSGAPVYCNRNADGEVWTTFMRRESGQILFNRSWEEYKKGFGKADGEFWSGNELLHQLTASKPMQLRIDMVDFDGNKAFAQYETFQIGSEGDKYRMTVNGYSGNAGNSLNDHKGMMFSTFDSDNDIDFRHCAEKYHAGWWFSYCFSANLNGVYHNHGDISKWDGIIWYTWKGANKALKLVVMKVR